MTINCFYGQPNDEGIYSRLKQLILCGGLKPQERMPEPYDMAGQLSVSPIMIMYIYHLLEEEGLLYFESEKEIFVSGSDKITALKRIMIEDEIKRVLKQAQGYGIEQEELVTMLSRQQSQTSGAAGKEEGNK